MVFSIFSKKVEPAGVEYNTSMVPAINLLLKSVDPAGVEPAIKRL